MNGELLFDEKTRDYNLISCRPTINEIAADEGFTAVLLKQVIYPNAMHLIYLGCEKAL